MLSSLLITGRVIIDKHGRRFFLSYFYYNAAPNRLTSSRLGNLQHQEQQQHTSNSNQQFQICNGRVHRKPRRAAAAAATTTTTLQICCCVSPRNLNTGYCRRLFVTNKQTSKHPGMRNRFQNVPSSELLNLGGALLFRLPFGINYNFILRSSHLQSERMFQGTPMAAVIQWAATQIYNFLLVPEVLYHSRFCLAQIRGWYDDWLTRKECSNARRPRQIH